MTAAATARQTADALVGAARQARKRADKADAVVRAAQQTIQISDKKAAANTQLEEANTLLEAAGGYSNRYAFVVDSARMRRAWFATNVAGTQSLVTWKRRPS